MKVSNQLSLNRIILLYRQLIFISGKQLLIVLGSTVGLIIGFHTFMFFVNRDQLGAEKIADEYHISVFLFAFFAGCLIWCGHSFPAFRSKEKSIEYLMTPCSVFEKFLFEFTNRIVVYLIGFPIVYWTFTNLVTSIFHIYYPNYQNYLFEFGALFSVLSSIEVALVCALVLLVFTIPFTGTSYFKKMPLFKTILIVFVLFGFYVFLGFLMVKGLHLEDYHPAERGPLFMKNEEHAKLAGLFAAILANVTLLTVSYFKVKEKEV